MASVQRLQEGSKLTLCNVDQAEEVKQRKRGKDVDTGDYYKGMHPKKPDGSVLVENKLIRDGRFLTPT